VGAPGELRMSAPKDEEPDPRSEHLDNLARMLREIEDELSDDDPEESPKPASPPSAA
jgi:hypothetical protein